MHGFDQLVGLVPLPNSVQCVNNFVSLASERYASEFPLIGCRQIGHNIRGFLFGQIDDLSNAIVRNLPIS
jgi:hypothetical protein